MFALDCYLFFFFQAEDGIRDGRVTGVQTCALPICRDATWATSWDASRRRRTSRPARAPCRRSRSTGKIGRASCREKSVDLGGRRIIKKKNKHTAGSTAV